MSPTNNKRPLLPVSGRPGNSNTIVKRATKLLVLLSLVMTVGINATPVENSFDSDGVRIRYVTEGEGSAVLLIHGFTWNLEGDWVDTGVFAGLVTAGYRVIAFDLRGHGKSEWPMLPENYGLEMVEDARRLLDHLEIEQAHVVGYSMGGIIAASLGGIHPNRVYSLTIGGKGFPFRVQEPLSEEQAARAFVEWNVPGKLSPKAIAAMSATYNDLAPDESMLLELDVPTQVVVGIDDSKERGKALADMIVGARFVVVPGDHEEASGTPEFYSAVLAFLEDQFTD